MGTVHQFPPAEAQTDTETGAGRKKARMEDGYTGLANELIEELMKAEYRLSGREYCILLAVIRKTFGYKKSADWIALSQFSELTTISKTHCHDVIKGLVARNMLTRSTIGNDQKLAINTDIGNWLKVNPLKSAETRKRQGRKAKQDGEKQTVPGLCNDIPESGNINTVSGNNLTGSGYHKRKRNKPNINTLVDDADASSTSVSESSPVDQVDQKATAIQTVDQPVQPKGPAKRQKRYLYEDWDYRLAERMSTDVKQLQVIPKKTNIESWANDIRILREKLRKANVDPRWIVRVWEYAKSHHFWSLNCQSPKTLGEKFNRLYIEAKSHLENRHENRTTGAGHRGAADPHNQFFGNVGREGLTEEDYDAIL